MAILSLLRVRSRLTIITTVVLRNRETLSATISLPKLLPLRPFLPINPRNLLTNPPDSPAVRQRHHLTPAAKAARCGLFHDDVKLLPVNRTLRYRCLVGRLPISDREGRVPEPRLLTEQHAFPEVTRASGLPEKSRGLTNGDQVVAVRAFGDVLD